MSNRLLSILILLWFIWAGYAYYNYSYLSQKRLEKIELQKKEQVEKVKKEKEISLVKVEEDNSAILSTWDKIKELIKKEKYYKTFWFDTGDNVSFLKFNNKLFVYLNDNKIWSFNLVWYDEINVLQVLGTKNYYLEIWNKKYYFDILNWDFKSLDFKANIIYIKKWVKNELIFVVNWGCILYNLLNNKYTLVSYFNDFIIYENIYIWLVKKDDFRILKNLWFSSNNKNLIVYYNPITKKKKTLFKTNLTIEKIYLSKNEIYLLDIDGLKYKLKNIKKNID